jgi:hypothetical protein
MSTIRSPFSSRLIMSNIFTFFRQFFTWIAQDLHFPLVLVIKSMLLKGELHQSRDYRYAPYNDVSVNNGPHIRLWSHKVIIYIMILYYNTFMLQLPTVFNTVTCCTGLWPRSNRVYHTAYSRLYYLGLCKYTL